MQIVPFASEYRDAFARLNLAWIEQHFVVEPHDREQLHEPETWILPNGGQIFIALVGDEPVGTCALIASAPGEFEMAKMCVREDFQGQGIGRALGEHALRWAAEQGARRVWLESNRRLETAIALYRKLGFVELPAQETPYARCDIWMERLLTAAST